MPKTAVDETPDEQAPRKPIYVSIQEAGHMLGLSRVSIFYLLEDDKIESRYHGRRRLVVLKSLEAYAANMPRERAS